MILSRFELNLNCREARRDLSNPYEMHRSLSRLLSNSRCLWRLEDRSVLLLSESAPDWDNLDKTYFQGRPSSRPYPVEKMMLDGRRLQFRLLANPTKSIREGMGKNSRGKRVQLVKEADLMDWLSRQAARSGFALESVTNSGNHDLRFRKKRGQSAVVLGTCLFEGVLRVQEADIFREALSQGLGRGKAFGLGLLSVAPA